MERGVQFNRILLVLQMVINVAHTVVVQHKEFVKLEPGQNITGNIVATFTAQSPRTLLRHVSGTHLGLMVHSHLRFIGRELLHVLFPLFWSHYSDLPFSQILHGLNSSSMGCVPIFAIAWTEKFT